MVINALLLSPKNCFELYIPNNRGQLIKACKTEADGRVVEGNHMVYRISAPTPEEKDEWIHSIKYVKKRKYWIKVKKMLLFMDTHLLYVCLPLVQISCQR